MIACSPERGFPGSTEPKCFRENNDEVPRTRPDRHQGQPVGHRSRAEQRGLHATCDRCADGRSVTVPPQQVTQLGKGHSTIAAQGSRVGPRSASNGQEPGSSVPGPL
ncbi:hypothetical protein [Kibdelosporangium philippinense]|uniref:hypothetical protein n=1 Tax=Kibdelosporangium philippinense TaxID=211113 RepID=UPI00361B9C94